MNDETGRQGDRATAFSSARLANPLRSSLSVNDRTVTEQCQTGLALARRRGVGHHTCPGAGSVGLWAKPPRIHQVAFSLFPFFSLFRCLGLFQPRLLSETKVESREIFVQ